MKTSDDTSLLIPALAKAQGAFQYAKKDKTNPFHHNKYADLASIQEACKPALIENGLIIIQDVNTEENSVLISTRIIHSSGQWMEVGPLSVPFIKRDPQGVGSAITYARRYSLSTMLCIVTEEDDDGNAASTAPEKNSNVNTVIRNKREQINRNSVEKITNEQHFILENELKKCTDKFVTNIDNNILVQFGASRRSEIPREAFDRVMNGIKIHLNDLEQKKVLQESHV